MAKNFRDTLNEQLKNSKFRAEWEALEPECQNIRAIIDGREANDLTQKQLAEGGEVTGAGHLPNVV